jgi:hypothetical protein
MKNEEKHSYKKIYQLTSDFSESPGMHCLRRDSEGFDVYRFYEGQLINDWPQDITFHCEVQFEDDYLLGGLHWKIVSERVREIFEKNKITGVQFLPVKILDSRSGQFVGEFWALNVIQTTNSLKLKDTKDLDIFRLAGKTGTGIFISERLKKMLEKSGSVRGMDFVEVPKRTVLR